jgi:hypothetical protein
MDTTSNNEGNQKGKKNKETHNRQRPILENCMLQSSFRGNVRDSADGQTLRLADRVSVSRRRFHSTHNFFFFVVTFPAVWSPAHVTTVQFSPVQLVGPLRTTRGLSLYVQLLVGP